MKRHNLFILLIYICTSLLLACSNNNSDETAEEPADIASKFFAFESGQVRPLAISPDGTKLFAVNTPDNRLEVFTITPTGLTFEASVPVGMEPVAVAARNNNEVWVVNHLSDSVSIVDVSAAIPRVTRTLLVGDEPRDIVFAGNAGDKAFITTAHRGQNAPYDPQLQTDGIGRADVWVFNAASLGISLKGDPITIINLFGDTPRALAASADGSRVYAAIFNSGNQTTVISGGFEVSPESDAGFAPIALDKPSPGTSSDGAPEPITGLIVKYNGSNWVDNGNPLTAEAPKTWDSYVNFNLPDYDVFEIDANAAIPTEINRYASVGTTLFNMAVNPNNNKIYVSNTEALNHIRFEGPGTNSTSVNGHFIENRITVIDASNINPRHLNKHITTYNQPLGTADENAKSLANPLEMVVTNDGSTLYLAAFGSSKIGIFDTSELENNTFTPDVADQIAVSGGGPTGLVLDEGNNRLYALTRFDNSIAIINTTTRLEIDKVSLFNPEPASIVAGRPFLYDASLTSSRGDSSCGLCHIFGDMDHLAWDLGDPSGQVLDSPNEYSPELLALGVTEEQLANTFHPLKGPMATQSLRGLAGNGPMHWRGDRTGASRDSDETLEEQAFEDFNVAFVGLLGRQTQLSDEQMQQFTDFALQLTYPPNPVRNLDNSLTTEQKAGRDVFMDKITDGLLTCNDCHKLNPAQRQFGTSSFMSIEGDVEEQDFKIPHLRNLYQKVGMFANVGGISGVAGPFAGDQIRGFGYVHSGASDNLRSFTLGNPNFAVSDEEGENINKFMLAFDSEMSPVVGQQVTISKNNLSSIEVINRLDLFIQRSLATVPRTECDLIFKGIINNEMRGGLLMANAEFQIDRAADAAITRDSLLQLITDQDTQLTFTCAPPGSGQRMGLDRDSDGIFDGDE